MTDQDSINMPTARWYIGKTHTGQPAIWSPRGLVATFEAGSEATRDSDARELRAALDELKQRRLEAQAAEDTQRDLDAIAEIIYNRHMQEHFDR